MKAKHPACPAGDTRQHAQLGPAMMTVTGRKSDAASYQNGRIMTSLPMEITMHLDN
jgi:hypothetical protein